LVDTVVIILLDELDWFPNRAEAVFLSLISVKLDSLLLGVITPRYLGASFKKVILFLRLKLVQ
jgi:hypothetical protein